MYQRLMDIMSERLLPIATKIGSQKHLVALHLLQRCLWL